MPRILYSISHILLVIFASVTPDILSKLSISWVSTFCCFHIVSISNYSSKTVLFNSFTCSLIFSSISLRDLFVSTCLPLFSCFFKGICLFLPVCLCFPVSLSRVYYIFLKGICHLQKWEVRPLYCFSVMLEYPGIALVEELGSDCAKLHWVCHIWSSAWLWPSGSLVLTGPGVSDCNWSPWRQRAL